MALNGFIYTIAVYFMPFISHLAAFSTAFTTTPNLHQNKPARESIICDKVGDWWTKKGTHNVKIYTENQTKKTIPLHTRAWAMVQKTPSLTTASTSGCKACCSWPTKTVSCKRRSNLPLTASFLACKECFEWLPSGHFLRHNHVFPQTNEAEFHISLYLCSVLRTWAGCLPWFYCTKTINSSQLIKTLKVKTTFYQWNQSHIQFFGNKILQFRTFLPNFTA